MGWHAGCSDREDPDVAKRPVDFVVSESQQRDGPMTAGASGASHPTEAPRLASDPARALDPSFMPALTGPERNGEYT
jgi:hypothetical protein